MKVCQTKLVLDYVTFLLAVLFELLLWKPSHAITCDKSAYHLLGHVLTKHSIQSFYGTSSSDSCLDKCAGNSSCHSINWYSKSGLCQINRGTHLSYPEGLVADSAGSYILYSLHPMVTCSNKYCSGQEICLMEDDGIDYRCDTSCDQPLGMEDKRITDSQITASSFSQVRSVPQCGRLNLVSASCAGSWIADGTESEGEYLQVDLLKVHIINKVATQGRVNVDKWVRKYYLTYSQDGVNWETYKYGGNNREEFIGNVDKNSVVTRTLPIPLQTRFIRVVVIQRVPARASMRIELYGCIAH